MKYFEDMKNKYGFDGKPFEGVEKYREVYLRVINKLAADKSSEVRLVPYDGHTNNWCMYDVVDVDFYNDNFDKEKFRVKPDKKNLIVEFPWDAQMEEAIEEANGLDLDQYIRTETYIMMDDLKDLL